MTDSLPARLLAVRDPAEARQLVKEAEQWMEAHPKDLRVLTAMEQAQRMASISAAEDLKPSV